MDLFKTPDINSKLLEAREVPGAVILDVRNTDEFSDGHIPGAISVPVDRIEQIREIVKKKDTPIYAYCLMGTRSSKAVAALKKMGYTNVTSIGGIRRYKGEIER